MANTNAIAAVFNLSAQIINTGTETSVASVSMPPNANVDSHSFRVRLIGKATGGTGATLQFKFHLGTVAGATVATFQVTPALVPVAGSNFSIVADYTWDSVSQTLIGVVGGQTAGQLTAAASVSTTGIASVAALQFVAGATFGAATATNSVTVEEFSIEQL